MANQEQLDLLKQGVKVWNEWRAMNEKEEGQIDLSGIDLSGTDLARANLRVANLNCANLTQAHLAQASLRVANLSGANLRGAELPQANLFGADLTRANLTSANLFEVNLSYANLTQANLRGATIGVTVFGNIDLSTVKGLDSIRHWSPSIIGIDTILLSKGNIPDVFLREAGVPDTWITYARALINHPIDYYSCFISYSSKDQSFAERLYADLQSKGVRCWFAPEDLKWGERIRTGIDEAIRLDDKLLLILSKSSVASGWVEREVKTALAKERKEQRTVLFPVRIGKAIFESPFDWATEIRHERNIGDFTRWKDHDAYQKAFDRLLRDLKAEP